MIVYPAIDIRGGLAVQLVGGRTDAQRVALPDPARVAMAWADAGFSALHVVDLDAALGTGSNRDAVAEIIDVSRVPVQVGGGIRDDETVADLFEVGAARVIIGTRAIEDAVWRAALSERFPELIVIAADVRGKQIMTHGWTRESGIQIGEFLAGLSSVPVAGVLITDVGREGRMVGVDVAMFEELVRTSPHPIIAAGGIRDVEDLRALAGAGVAGAVLGMSLYTGAIDPKSAALEFA